MRHGNWARILALSMCLKLSLLSGVNNEYNEHYRMGIPLFFAAHETFVDWNIKYRLVYDRTSAMRKGFSTGSDIPPHESEKGVPDPNDECDPVSQRHWFRLADFYTLPHITYFQSIEHLVNILNEMSRERLLSINVMYSLRRPASKAVLNDSRALGELPSLYGFSAE